MLKKTIFTLMLVAMMGYVSAQSLRFELNGTVYDDGAGIVCNTEEYGEYLQEMQLHNLTSNDLNVIVEKEVVESLEGVMDYFCWGQCLSPTAFVSDPVEVTAGTITEPGALSFHAMFEDDVFGYVVVRYYAYDERHPDERVSINVKFHKSGESIDETSTGQFSQAYPNPSKSMVHFDYSLNQSATAVVYNLLGQEVMRHELNTFQGQLSFSVADLQDGIYFCNLTSEGRTLNTVKFVVKK